jgi:DNA polymerase epsilon subunit 1
MTSLQVLLAPNVRKMYEEREEGNELDNGMAKIFSHKQKRMKDDLSASRLLRSQKSDAIDAKFGYERHKEPFVRTGWLINMHPNDVHDDQKRLVSSVDFFFVEEDGSRFKVSFPYQPYFYIQTKPDTEKEVVAYYSKRFAGRIAGMDLVEKEDLDLANHLVGIRGKFLKLRFHSVEDLIKARREILPIVRRNKERDKAKSAYDPSLFQVYTEGVTRPSNEAPGNQTDHIIDIREYDVPYHVRVAIDNRINVGHWYNVKGHGSEPPEISLVKEEPDRPDPVVLAYDIETTKLPLKFPDPSTDMIMMISYMIDGQGYLLTNREIVGADVENFEYTPKPEYEGPFIIYNEPDEVSVIRRFFDHILEVKPNIIVTYNGDSFDWPFVEARAAFHQIDMEEEIGYAPDSQNEYKCRPVIHMDAFRWVKRDSYLPVGSQNLKATTKAKLRYDPVELDPEDMCRMASENPQGLANYSVSDAVATYYLYMKYVHPFIFALCTIIPMEPDEVLRKGSGTLCETLLMVQAYHGNIVFPNKQEQELNKLTNDGHLLEQETYVGGHVEALESGVFRSDIPCRFKLVPSALQDLIDNVEHTVRHTVEIEEKVPMEKTTNYEEVCQAIVDQLTVLRDNPARYENPMIYHLDVGAMYPNIILTNRLQPPAIVDEADCAACDFNKPGATCQRKMKWIWRGDFMPASRNEYQSIKQQLEVESFPPEKPGDNPRSFHQLPRAEQAKYERKRLADYCRRAYKKVKQTREEVRTTTVCQRENSFYVDTVRAFRDRRYTFKGLLKVWKKKLDAAKKKGDPAEIKSCANKEILYDSLQLAHKCILNSFYGYVMRKGSRWHSMEMAGLVCYTGASIITKAREIVENLGRPLELDTDGIWCVLPSSFPENFEIHTTDPKKPKITFSYPGAMLNVMVHDNFTNDQYQELVDPEGLVYEERKENSIFFEVDGPYKAMILPASKEEGKKLKKRYAVFNFDGSLAELKGFEVKRRGELQLIKNFQSSVFESFLSGGTLEECYASVSKVADYWLDVLYSQAENMPDSELFGLISENRSMSRKLEDYGEQKSTSISTAKRLAEFLGDQMVKDAGLSCRFVISKKPEGAPVTERAIPLTIFQAEPSVRKFYLRKWLKSPSLDDYDIRAILDWEYYIERLGSAIQKIVTIPAAMQGVSNPVPRVHHPDWLHKKLLEKNDVFRQRKINDMFSAMKKLPSTDDDDNSADKKGEASSKRPLEEDVVDLEDLTNARSGANRSKKKSFFTVTKRSKGSEKENTTATAARKSWRQILGPPPSKGKTKEDFEKWLKYHKEKWRLQKLERQEKKRSGINTSTDVTPGNVQGSSARGRLGGFLQQRTRTVFTSPWQIIQIQETDIPGVMEVWALIGSDLHRMKVTVPRTFYVNCRSPKSIEGDAVSWRQVSRHLPRSKPVLFLYEYSVPEEVFQQYSGELMTQLSSPDIEGVYETQVSLLFRALCNVGCVCTVSKEATKELEGIERESFQLKHLEYRTLAQYAYLKENSFKYIFVYHTQCDHRSIVGCVAVASKKGGLFVLDRIRSNQLPNLNTAYTSERADRAKSYPEGTFPSDGFSPPENINFEARVETDSKQVWRGVHRWLSEYREEGRGPTILVVQSPLGAKKLSQNIPVMREFPFIEFQSLDEENRYPTLNWQKPVAKGFIRQFFNSSSLLANRLEQARYSHIPIGNLPPDPFIFISDVFYARNLIKSTYTLWASPSDRPDLGGCEDDDHRLMTDFEEGRSVECNNPGCYPTICIELRLDGLAVDTVLQSNRINDYEGASGSSVAFDSAPQASLEELLDGTAKSSLTVYDEAALCSGAFRIMKSMVHTWLHEVSAYQNYYADFQLVHFLRWLRSPSTLLYEPALCRIVHSLMKKLFYQLIAELKRLGSTIIYADFNKIILCTKKRRIEDASGYILFVLNTILSKDLFHSLSLKPTACWEFLLWMDQANHGGIKGTLPNDLKYYGEDPEEIAAMETDSQDFEFEEGDSTKKVEMNWNICKYLPSEASCQDFFQVVIGGHIHELYKHSMEERRRLNPGDTPVRRQIRNSQDLNTTVSGVSFAKNRIEKDITQQLFMIVQKIHSQLEGIDEEVDQLFPVLAGSHLNLSKPTLEFVKYVCKVLSLDISTQYSISKLRRDLLKLIGVKEFSDEAIFQDPCLSFVLPEVICEMCNNCRDLDLCRDPHILSDEDGRTMWRCSHCGNAYDLALIEQSLINAVQRRSMSYTLQDLICTRCNQVKDVNMMEYCPCGGRYSRTLSSDSFTQQMKTFRNIARHYGMVILEDTVSWICDHNPRLFEGTN